jgi:hypothetical protein
MDEKQWSDHPARAGELNKILRDPVLIDALEVLTAQGLLPITPPPVAGYSLMEFNALANRWREGYLACLANLKLLAKIKPFRPRDETSWKASPDKYEEARKASELKPEKVTFGDTPIKFD